MGQQWHVTCGNRRIGCVRRWLMNRPTRGGLRSCHSTREPAISILIGDVSVVGVGGTKLVTIPAQPPGRSTRQSEEHTSELQSRENLVCRLLLEKKKKTTIHRQNN